MTGTITLTTDIPNERIGVQLGSWAAADGPITVMRVHPDTSEWAVRGFTVTSGGAAFVYDYEAPFNQSVNYYAYDGSTRVTSSSTSLPISYALLRGPGLPANDATFEVTGRPKVKAARPNTRLSPIGRKNAVVLTGARGSGEFTLTVETHSDTEAAQLETCLDGSATCLLLVPGWRKSWLYVTVTANEEDPFAPMLASTGTDPGSWSQTTLDCIITDPPVGGVFGDPSASYTAVKTNYATYTALRTAKSSYLQILKGVP